jgi:hypothetical protein
MRYSSFLGGNFEDDEQSGSENETKKLSNKGAHFNLVHAASSKEPFTSINRVFLDKGYFERPYFSSD